MAKKIMISNKLTGSVFSSGNDIDFFICKESFSTKPKNIHKVSDLPVIDGWLGIFSSKPDYELPCMVLIGGEEDGMVCLEIPDDGYLVLSVHDKNNLEALDSKGEVSKIERSKKKVKPAVSKNVEKAKEEKKKVEPKESVKKEEEKKD